MRVTTAGDPVAGEDLEIEIVLESRREIITALVGDTKLFSRTYQCPDPPCHERLNFRLPANSEGKNLHFEIDDARGRTRIAHRIRGLFA